MNQTSRIWGVVLGLALFFHLLTIRFSPVIWQDEVQIIDFGRILMPDADLSYAMTWLSKERRPAQYLGYLGNFTQNLFFVWTGGDIVGPRLVALAGAGFSATALLGWFLAAGVSRRVALGCALLFLLDPLLTHGYRGARVDVWSMGFMFLAFWSVRHAKGKKIFSHVLPGIFVALSGLTWISAILLTPLLLLEIYEANKPDGGTSLRVFRGSLFQVLWVGLASFITLGLLLMPFAHIWPLMVSDLHSITGGRVMSGDSRMQGLLVPFLQSPWVLLGGIFAMIREKKWAWCAAFCAAVAGVCLTGPYMHRDTYLLPYLLLGFPVLLSADSSGKSAIFAGKSYLVLSLAWGGLVSVGYRTATAFLETNENDPRIAETLWQQALSAGSVDGRKPGSVFLGEWQLYHAARKAGVKFYRQDIEWNQADDLQLLHDIDMVIFPAGTTGLQQKKILGQLGFQELDPIRPFQMAKREPAIWEAPPRRRYHEIEVWRKKKST